MRGEFPVCLMLLQASIQLLMQKCEIIPHIFVGMDQLNHQGSNSSA